MSTNFLKFKKRLGAIRIAKSAMVGIAAGMVGGGAVLLLSKNLIIPLAPIASIYIGIGIMLIAAGITFLFSGRSDHSLAEELDSSFGLKARVQTMIEYRGEEGEMLDMQRQDTEAALAEIPVKAYKFKGLWIYILALLLSAAILTVGIILPDMRNFTPPEEVEPFSLSELQAAGLNELIKYVENSALEEEFKTPMAEELRDLLSELREIDTKPDMQAALAETMAILLDITYESSTATEMLNALWDTEEIYFRYLAKVLDAGTQGVPEWGDFAEKLAEYIEILMGDKDTSENALVGKARLKFAIDSMTRRLDVALDASGLAEDDEMYLAVDNLFNNSLLGLSSLMGQLDLMSEDEAREALKQRLDLMSESTFEAVLLNRTNAYVGEYAMTRLASLFLVPLPEFERPEFVKNNESVDGSTDGVGDDDDPNGVHGGGLGQGATFGSDDYVLDPRTGKYVKYGDLINEYNAVMLERLQGDYYTEEQKKVIEKYFGLLYSGLEEEGK